LRTIKHEVEQSMTGLTRDGKSLVSRFLFPEEFIGFQGHFPGKKILPGVCQVQCVIATLEKAYKKTVVLKEIMVAKYLAPLSPGEEMTCVCGELQDKDGDLIMKTVISRNDVKIAELKLRFRFQ
jgi:3-hydroxyacyl-[acyl-carrier-protein] dehydratase